ncbi:MAG: aspartate carbamoyltransferase catalytic subunit [Bdellovibrio sp.]|nr:aspartate carbamoyltransferase catalytic subunit [Bdellovibrio sp.]
MPPSKSSLINLKNLSVKTVGSLFSKTLELKKNFNQYQRSAGVYHSGYKGTAALLFLEPSTRTRFSFEAACSRAGYHPLILDGIAGTSLEKGETIEDTIFNIEAMRPLFFVIRSDDQFDMQQMVEKISVPIINAGWGKRGHPTQALLDAVTIFEKRGDLAKQNILFIGDIKHSRVVSSHIELAATTGSPLAFCAPENFLPEQITSGVKVFRKLEEALDWATVIMALRVQKERHGVDAWFSVEDYRKNFGINLDRVQKLNPDSLLMHPGPINYGVEIESEILTDPRCVILKQVENGVFLREALIRNLFDGDL